MNEELKCPKCQQKDKEIAKLKEALEIQKNLTRQAYFESDRAYDKAEKWEKMFYDLVYNQSTICTDPNIVIIGKDLDVYTDGTDNNVGSMEE